MAYIRVFLHLPSGKNLHFLDSAVLCIWHPDAISKTVITLSTSMKSQALVIAGFKSSQYAYKIYLVSSGQITWGRVGNGCLKMGIYRWVEESRETW